MFAARNAIRIHMMTNQSPFAPGRKYAMIGLRLRNLTTDSSVSVQLGHGLYCWHELPIPFPQPWRDWLGSIRIDEIKECNLFLCATESSNRPDVLDQENESLLRRVHRLYHALLVAAPVIGHQLGHRFSGGTHNNQIDVSQVGNYPAVHRIPGTPPWRILPQHLHRAKRVSTGMARLGAHSEFRRIWRMLHAFYAGLRSRYPGETAFQFVRVIEGFVLTKPGQGGPEFTRRTRLFVGDDCDELTRQLYTIRNHVAHLHDPLRTFNGNGHETSNMLLCQAAWQAEVVARYCLRRVFTRKELWPHFSNTDTIETFWTLGERQRDIWGDALDRDQWTTSYRQDVYDWSARRSGSRTSRETVDRNA